MMQIVSTSILQSNISMTTLFKQFIMKKQDPKGQVESTQTKKKKRERKKEIPDCDLVIRLTIRTPVHT